MAALSVFFTMRRDFVYFCGYNFGIAEILLGYYIEVVVELIDKRNAGREIDFHYLVRGQLFEMHDERGGEIICVAHTLLFCIPCIRAEAPG